MCMCVYIIVLAPRVSHWIWSSQVALYALISELQGSLGSPIPVLGEQTHSAPHFFQLLMWVGPGESKLGLHAFFTN